MSVLPSCIHADTEIGFDGYVTLLLLVITIMTLNCSYVNYRKRSHLMSLLDAYTLLSFVCFDFVHHQSQINYHTAVLCSSSTN